MQKDKLKELIKQCLSSVLDEESSTGGVPGYLGVKAFKPKYESANKAFNRNPARTKTAQDTNSPSGFESMPDSAKVYIKGGFRVIKPEERIDAKDLWKGSHLEENIAVITPKAFKKPKKQHETSKAGHEDLPNPDKYFELVKFKIVDSKEKINENQSPLPTNDQVRKLLSKLEQETNYLFDKDVNSWDEYDVSNWKSLVTKAKDKQINESRYGSFVKETKTRTPQEQLHMGVKEMQRKLDEINRLVDFTTRMKTELKGDAEEMNLLKRTHNSLFKINEKIQEINNKIKSLTT